MKPIPGWLTGVIILFVVIFLGAAAIIPRTVSVTVNATNEVENDSTTTNYYNAPVAYDIDHHNAPVGEDTSPDQ